MKSNIALIGFMGTGKTAVGQALAKRLKHPFIETDAVIVRMAGKSIPAIFQDDGEIYFRELEIEAIKQAAAGEKKVIACGGGAVLNTLNIDRLKKNGVVINLSASPGIILKRISVDKNERPLIAGTQPEARIRELMKFRKPFYTRSADFTVSTSSLAIDTVAGIIIDRLNNYEGFDL
jgi:shikimate kinase